MNNITSNKGKNELEFENVDKLLLKFSVPAIIATSVTIIQGVTDRYFIGKYVGINGMEAISLLFPMIIFISGISALLAIGGGNLFTIKIGGKDNHYARKIYNLTISLSILIGLFYSVIILVFSRNIIHFLGANASTYKDVQNYNISTAPFVIFQILFVVYTTFIRIDNKPKLSMIYGIINTLINVVFNYIFIVHLKLGILGAGFATSLSSILVVIIMILKLRKNKMLVFSFKELKLYLDDTKKIFDIGSGTFISQLLNSVTMILMNRQLLKYGTTLSIASFSVVSMARTIINLIPTGIIQGRGPILSFNYGAKNYSRVHEVTNKSIFYGITISIFCTLVVLSLGGKFTSFFIKDNIELIKITAINMRYYLIGMFGTALYLTTSNFFQGVGRGGITFKLAILRLLVIFMPLLTILPIYFGEIGVWLSFPIAEIISGFISYFIMKKYLKIFL